VVVVNGKLLPPQMGAFREHVLDYRGRVVFGSYQISITSVLSPAVMSSEFAYYINAQYLYKHNYSHRNTLN
jgi:hypothetical protein